MSASQAKLEARRRANTELGLLVLALIICVVAYALVGLAREPQLPAGMAVYGGILAGIALGTHIFTRRVAPGADPLLFPLAFASSVFVLPATMPDWLQTFAAHNPLSRLADAVRALTIGGYPCGASLEAITLCTDATPNALWSIGWSLVIVALTLVFGRVFWGWICPFGTLHHFFAWIFPPLIRAMDAGGMEYPTLITAGTRVRAVATIEGGSYSATCGTAVSGAKWYRIDAVNGTSVSSLYGVSYVYAAAVAVVTAYPLLWMLGVEGAVVGMASDTCHPDEQSDEGSRSRERFDSEIPRSPEAPSG